MTFVFKWNYIDKVASLLLLELGWGGVNQGL